MDITFGKEKKTFNCFQVIHKPAKPAEVELNSLQDGFWDIGKGGITAFIVTLVLQPADPRNKTPIFYQPKVK